MRQGEFGQVNVYLSGTALVQDDHTTALALDSSGVPVVINWTNTGSQAAVTSGKAGGELNAVNSTIPGYIANLDNVATTLRDEVNALHGAISGSIATTAQDQTAAATLSFDVAVDGGAFTTITINGADWSGAGGDGRAADRAASCARHGARRRECDRHRQSAAREARSTSASWARACTR